MKFVLRYYTKYNGAGSECLCVWLFNELLKLSLSLNMKFVLDFKVKTAVLL